MCKLCLGLECKNYTTLNKKIKDPNKWRDVPCSWIGLSIKKMSVLLKFIYMFNSIPIKTTASIFVDIYISILKVI